MGPSASNLAANSSPPTEYSEEPIMVHPMRELLDEGGLTPKSRDRNFTTFFDLKQERHHDFLTRLRDHVQTYGYRWSELEQSNQERELCAESFVEQWGEFYWGTEENRKDHLLQESLDDPDSLCVYPEQKREIVEALEILLERKAKSAMKKELPIRQSIETVNTPSAPKRPIQPSSAPQPAVRKENKAKRKKEDHVTGSPSLSDDAPRPAVARKTTAAAQPIRPFHTVASPERNNQRKSKPHAKNHEPLISLLDNSPSSITGRNPFGNSESSTAAMSAKTHFLVSSSNQQGMAPIWIPFKKFSSATSFLSHMLSECTLQYWDSQAQTLIDMQPERLQVVVAASIKFAWSNYEIRLRQGMDQDLSLCMAQLEKAWAETELSKGGDLYYGFKVLVLLHVMG